MVSRKILINKIPTMNVNNQVLTSLASFLSNRLQYVLVKNKKIKYSVVLQRCPTRLKNGFYSLSYIYERYLIIDLEGNNAIKR